MKQKNREKRLKRRQNTWDEQIAKMRSGATGKSGKYSYHRPGSLKK